MVPEQRRLKGEITALDTDKESRSIPLIQRRILFQITLRDSRNPHQHAAPLGLGSQSQLAPQIIAVP